MPIYAYRCDRCGIEKDVLQKLSEAPLTVCPECGAEAFHKRLTAPAFQLKGSGWYVTDFRDNGKKDAKAGASGEAKPADATSSGSKPEANTGAAAAPASAPAAAAPAAGAKSD